MEMQLKAEKFTNSDEGGMTSKKRGRPLVCACMPCLLTVVLCTACIFIAEEYPAPLWKTANTTSCANATVPAETSASAVKAVNAFYAAVDTRDLPGIGTTTTAAYVAVFGAGCSSVGGAERCGEGALPLAGFKAMVAAAPAKAQAGDAAIQRAFTYEDSGVVTNHYTVGKSGAHGAAIHHVVGGKVASSVWYIDQKMNVRVVESFYQAIDTLSLKEGAGRKAFLAMLAPGYVAVFGKGRAGVGGATLTVDTKPQIKNGTQLADWVTGFPARCNASTGTSGCQGMQREFVAGKAEVTNHYTVSGKEAVTLGGKGATVHGTATHRLRDGKLVESFWYTHDEADKCGAAVHSTRTQEYYAAVDYLTSVKRDNTVDKQKKDLITGYVVPTYVAVFAPGVAAVGGNVINATAPTVMDLTAFMNFLTGCSTTAAAATYSCTVESEHMPCTAAGSKDCINRTLTSAGSTVSNRYSVNDTAGTVVHTGNAVHRFEGEKLVESFWYPSATGHQ